MHINDNRICKLLNEHNPHGMELLFNAYYRPLVLWADSFVNDVSAAEDIVQDFFLYAWDKRIFSRISNINLRSYLFTSIKNNSLRYLNKRDPIRNSEPDFKFVIDFLDPEDLTDEMIMAVKKEIENLPPRTREVLKAVYFEGLKYKDVAEKFLISISTVKTLIITALRKLRGIFLIKE